MSQLDTGSGFIQGAEPAQPRTAADVQPQPGQNGPLVVVQGGQPTPAPQPTNGRFYSEEDVARMRAETDGRLQTMESELQQLRTDREEREAAAAAEQERLAAEARTQAEAAMDVRQLLEQKDQEWRTRFTEMESQRERDQAIFERERAWNELQDYKRNRVTQEQDAILPELRDLVRGDDAPEIEASIEQMKARSASILAEMRAAYDSVRPPAPVRGVASTGQPSMGGPMDGQGQAGIETITVSDIQGMDNKTYGAYRDRLMRFATTGGQAPPL
jgi:hypothetical protein